MAQKHQTPTEQKGKALDLWGRKIASSDPTTTLDDLNLLQSEY